MKNILTQSLAKFFLPEGQNNVVGYHFNNGQDNQTMLNATRSAATLIAHFFSTLR